jgi:hypothetical protein
MFCKPTYSIIGLSLSLLAGSAACKQESKESKQEAQEKAPTTAAVKEAPKVEAQAAEKAPAIGLREGEHAKLAILVGEWSGTGSLKMGPNEMAVTSKYRCDVAEGGVALTCVHNADIEGMGPMVENALIGFDPAEQKLHWYNINTMGENHDHVGEWTSDQKIQWSYKGKQDGKPLTESISMEIKGTNELSFRSETTVDGKPGVLFVGTLRK